MESYYGIPPIQSIVYSAPPPPSSFYSPPPPPPSQSNANSDPPSSTPSFPTPPPHVFTAPPPTLSSPPPPLPTSPPPTSQPPLPSADSPPLASSPPPSPAVSPPPPSVDSPPPESSPSPPTLSPPPPSSLPPSPTLSPPPPLPVPPLISPLPPPLPSSPPPTPPLPPPHVVDSPPPTIPPLSSYVYSSPPPPLDNPPTSSLSPPSPSPPPPLANPPRSSPPSPSINSHTDSSPPPPPPSVQPPTSSFIPPPSANSTENSPPPPVLPSPLGSQPPPLSPSPPPAEGPVPSTPSPPPSNSGATPSTPAVPSPLTPSTTPYLPSPTDPSSKPLTPIIPRTISSSSTPGTRVGPGSSNSSNNGILTGNTATIAVVAGLVMLTFVGAAVWFVRKHRKPVGPGGHAGGFVMPSQVGSSQMSETSNPRSVSLPLVRYSSGSRGFAYSSSDPGLGNSKLWFTYEELSTITNGFSTQNILGEGGFGCVYKGCLQDGREVAVKQLKVGSAQGEREFKAEVEIISRVHHRHLVSLVGYCISEQQRLLVYDYVPNNTLYYHLHGKGGPTMDWATRVKVAAGAARGIAYLHEDCQPRIIHRDIKSSNILLDNNFEAKVSDFGLARLSLDACTHVTTRVMGTFGYLSPEYASTGKLTAKSDVYSFGVVLLELVTGRKPVDTSQPLGDESLVEWARPLLSGALESGDYGDLPDPRLEKNYVESEMFRMVEAAAACVRHSAAMRPRLGQVVRALDSLGDLDINNGVKPGQSELFTLEPQSEEITRFQRRAFGSQDYSSDVSQASWKSRRDL